MTDMDDDLPQPELPANLKFLRLLVTVLTGTMILGLIVIIALLVIRFRTPAPDLPAVLTLPDGATATAFTQGPTWYAVVTEDNRILIYNRFTGILSQTIRIQP